MYAHVLRAQVRALGGFRRAEKVSTRRIAALDPLCFQHDSDLPDGIARDDIMD
eukprot:COSAG02_NODE_212_length_28729_cov_45.980196_6_plen_53_part_00